MPGLTELLQPDFLRDAIIAKVLSPGHFFIHAAFELIFEKPIIETVTWEVFRGQLLDARHTRTQQTFSSHHVRFKSIQSSASQPLLSIRVDGAAELEPPGARQLRPRTLHVTRWLECRIWEAFDDTGTIGSREVERSVEELVGSIPLEDCAGVEQVHYELGLLLLHAFVGLSRLPLNSVEAPLPVFSLGMAGFFPGLQHGLVYGSNPLTLIQQTCQSVSDFGLVETKQLELFLRTATPIELALGSKLLSQQWQERGTAEAALMARLRRLFNEVSLTPYTDFVDKALTFASMLFDDATLSLAGYADFLTGLLRQTVYHLTAYDLITFHHQGANYPDALLLNALLHDLLLLAKVEPQVLASAANADKVQRAKTRRRRRALLLGWWMHRLIERLPVPDEPTSPGENARVLPLPHRRVPEEQLQQRGRRTSKLFADQPIDWQAHRALLESCVTELVGPEMLQELGTALYLDRPFGSTKPPAALDLTPLLSYELFSRTVARERLNRMGRLEPMLKSNPILDDALKQLDNLQVPGVRVPPTVRALQTVSLQDCWRIADDFVVRRPTPETIRQLRRYFDWNAAPLPFSDWPERGLMPVPFPGESPQAPTRIVFYDAEWKPQFECLVAAENGFQRRAALELPTPGLSFMDGNSRILIAARLPGSIC